VGIHSIIRIKQPDSKFDHSTPFIVEFKNEWSSTYISPTSLEKVDFDNFTFLLTKFEVMSAWAHVLWVPQL